MRIEAKAMLALASALTLTACTKAAPQPPPLAPDRTAMPAARQTSVTCEWVPPLPAEREGYCQQSNAGTQVQVVQREDMREGSAVRQTSTCVCR